MKVAVGLLSGVTIDHLSSGECAEQNRGGSAICGSARSVRSRSSPTIFSALTRAAERWRSVKVTEFERRQMATVRKEPDQEYEAMVDLNAKPFKGAGPGQNIQQKSNLTFGRDQAMPKSRV